MAKDKDTTTEQPNATVHLYLRSQVRCTDKEADAIADAAKALGDVIVETDPGQSHGSVTVEYDSEEGATHAGAGATKPPRLILIGIKEEMRAAHRAGHHAKE